uniref:Uncharacterized protein n=1 Tax=Knipowitschia caucasica TaxID=637954 RepID=A0AAV2M6M8_KNICA
MNPNINMADRGEGFLQRLCLTRTPATKQCISIRGGGQLSRQADGTRHGSECEGTEQLQGLLLGFHKTTNSSLNQG